MMSETVSFLEERKTQQKTFTYEIIVVDDGSRDNTKEVVMEFAQQHKYADIRLLALEKNRGKGGAVTQVRMMIMMVSFTRRSNGCVCVSRVCYVLVVNGA